MATRGWNDVTAADVAKMGRQATRMPQGKTSGRSKYGAIKTVVDGIRFDSKAEARRYQQLRILERLGQLHDLELQPVYPLIVAGEAVGFYRADFGYTRPDGEIVVEDVKGMRTLPLARWKQKHMRAQYGITVVEVR